MTARLPFGRMVTAMVFFSALGVGAAALDKSDLELVFQDDFESGADGWTYTNSDFWRVELEEGTGNHVLSLFKSGPPAREFEAPGSIAFVEGLSAGDFILEARIRQRGNVYAHQDLVVVYNQESPYRLYYTHFGFKADDWANTIFRVDNVRRVSIATERTDGTPWNDAWHDIRIVRDVDAGSIEVFFDDMNDPVMVANDGMFRTGAIGLGSYNDAGWFDDVKIWARPDEPEAQGYTSIFDGETLDGWSAPNMSYWSVEDGAITTESTEANPCDVNQFLVWQGGDVANFELKAKFRLANNQGNSGIQFRSRIADDGMGVGYQADILPGGPWCGALADEYTGREPLMVPNGHKTVVEKDGTRTCVAIDEPVGLRPAGEWNDYHITAIGHRIVLRINGMISAEFIDYDEKEFDATGILALQLRSGPPMKAQFKDVYLKLLP